MQDRPDADELLIAVAEFLREQAAPHLQGQRAFHARVAANLIDLVRRQIAPAGDSEADERRGLHALLHADGTLAELNLHLCQHIADGTIGLHTPGLADHLWRVTLAKLAVDQPHYDTFRRLSALPPPPEAPR